MVTVGLPVPAQATGAATTPGAGTTAARVTQATPPQGPLSPQWMSKHLKSDKARPSKDTTLTPRYTDGSHGPTSRTPRTTSTAQPATTSATATTTASAPTSPPFTECPAVGADTSCGLLVVITDTGSSVLGDPSQGPYDSVEDTLIGVVNNSSKPLGALALTSTTDLFGFDGDGICGYGAGSCGPTGYEGPNTGFSDISPDYASGVVDFPAGLAAGASTYFSLEESLSTSNVTTGTGQGAVTAHEVGWAPNPREPLHDCSTGQPINCASGDFWHTFNDISVPGRGPALQLQRSYNAFGHAGDSMFGYGWSSSYGLNLSTDSAGNVTVTQENGSVITFNPNGYGGYTAPSRVMASLVANSDGTLTLTDLHGGVSHTFSAAGQLLRISDRNGYTNTLTYTGAALSSVTDQAGRSLSFTTDGTGHVTAVTDPAGRQVGYGYDGAGNLTSATDLTGGVWAYSYDASHQMLTMTDPRGGVVTNTYDGSGRVTAQQDALGRTTTLGYAGDPETTTGSTTTITDPRGLVAVQSYQQMQLQSVTHASGTPAATTTSYSYDPFTLQISSVTDPNGHTHTFTYDRHGNLMGSTDALGRSTRFTWTGLNEPASFTDPLGNSTTYSYDGNGNLTAVYRALNASVTQSRTFAHADSVHPGDITSMVDPNGYTWTMAYDADGDVTSLADPLGDKTTYGYDNTGRRTSAVSPRGNAAGAVPAAFTTTMSYDAAGALTSVVDALGKVRSFSYDANHNQTVATDANGKATTTTFDADNEAIRVLRADGTSLSSAFDSDGNRTTQVDGAGHPTGYSFDSLNRLATITDPLGRATTYGYDPTGNVTTVTDPTGAVTTMAYDNTDELTGKSFSDGSTPAQSWTYTQDRLPATMADGTGTTSYSYDGLGRLTSQTNGAGQAVSYGYDLVGHLTGLSYPNGSTVSRGYDAGGRLTTVTDWNNHTTTFNPDADGNTTSQTYGNGVSAAATFDATDAMTSTTDTAAGGTTLASLVYTRDANSQLASSTATGLPGGNESYSYNQLEQLTGVNAGSYSYDAAGNLTTLLNGATLGYDRANEATSFTPAGGQAVSLQYDARGDRTAGPGTAGAAATYVYDQASQLTKATSTTAGSGSASSLIAGGQYHSLAVDSAGSVWAWGYNADGELGNGSTASAATPVRVTGAPAAAGITAGLLSSVELTRTGTVRAWGNNAYGQLGNGTATSSSTPVAVSSLSGVAQVGAGNYHVLALRSDGTVAAWGLNNAGQLGDGTVTSRSTPVTVAGLSGVTQIAAGGLPGYAGHSVALKADGSVWTWGYGKSGQLGLGSLTSTGTPTKVAGLPVIAQVAANGDDTYAVGKDGSLWAWGAGSYGQLGNAAASNRQPTPVQVNLANVKSVGAGGTHALAITIDGKTWAWGNDNTGQLGDNGACGKTCVTPVQISGLTGVTAVTGGYVHSLAALSDGTLRAWGRNAEGELGDGTTTVRMTPVAVSGLSGIVGSSSTTSTYAYDGSGHRASRTTSTSTQHFAWDLAGGLPLVLTDGSTSYLYDDAGAPIEQVDSAGNTLYYQHDQYGSTRLLTTQTGTVAAAFSYDAYGNLTGHTGTADTQLRWNGQYQDSDTGLYYLHARYYDPATAQFITRDPLAMLTGSPYGYAGGNPLNGSDPSGLFCWSASCLITDAGIAVAGVAVAAAVVVLAPEVVVGGAVAVTVEEVGALAVTEAGEAVVVSATTTTVEVTAGISSTEVAATVGDITEIAGYGVGLAKVVNSCQDGLSAECQSSLIELGTSVGMGQLGKVLDNDWWKLGNDVREFISALGSAAPEGEPDTAC